MGAGPLQHGAAQGGVGASVLQEAGPHGGDVSCGVRGHRVFHFEGVALGVDPETLLAAQGHLHGNTSGPSQQRRVVLDDEVLLAAKAPAHIGADHLDLIRSHAQDAGDALVVVINALCASVDSQCPIGFRHCQGAFGLHESVLGFGRVEGVVDEVDCLSEGLVHIAAL